MRLGKVQVQEVWSEPVIYTFRAPVALRGRVLTFIQRREVITVGHRLLVELVANDPTSRGIRSLCLSSTSGVA
jgi:hypothetical protein